MADEVAPGVWVGTADEAWERHEDGFVVVSLLQEPGPLPRTHHVPLLDGARAGRAALDRVADLVEGARSRGLRVFLHCHHGVERAPLAAAWWLWTKGHAPTLDAAYAQVLARRPAARRREGLLPRG